MLTLEAQKRDIFGKKLTASRKEGLLPVVIYGHKEKGSSFFVNKRDFEKIWAMAGESAIVTLLTPEGKKETLIHEVSFHPLTEEPLHADFLAIDTTRVTRVKAPFVFEGISPAVKNLGGILVKAMHELEVEALPKDLPRQVKVDVSSLTQIGASLKVKDIKLPPAVKIISSPEEMIVLVKEVKEEVIEEAPADLAAIEVEKKGKVEEGVTPGAAESLEAEAVKKPEAKKPETKK